MFVNELLSGVCGFPCEILAFDTELPSVAFVVSSPTEVLFEEAKPAMVPLDRRLLRLAFEIIVLREEKLDEVEDSMLTAPEDLDASMLWLRKEADLCSLQYLSAFFTKVQYGLQLIDAFVQRFFLLPEQTASCLK